MLAALVPASSMASNDPGLLLEPGVCTGSMQLQFNSPITAVPSTSTIGFNVVNGSAGCTTLYGTQLTWYGGGGADPGASCATLASLFGSLSVRTPSGAFVPLVAFQEAGATAAETWEMNDGSSAAQFYGAGEFAWTDTAEILGCLGGGTRTITLEGALVIAAR